MSDSNCSSTDCTVHSHLIHSFTALWLCTERIPYPARTANIVHQNDSGPNQFWYLDSRLGSSWSKCTMPTMFSLRRLGPIFFANVWAFTLRIIRFKHTWTKNLNRDLLVFNFQVYSYVNICKGHTHIPNLIPQKKWTIVLEWNRISYIYTNALE